MISSLGMQIVLRISFQYMPKAFPVPRQYGQTRNITVIARCLQTLQLKCGSLSPKLSTFCIRQVPLGTGTPLCNPKP
jgi:hypothetical protein